MVRSTGSGMSVFDFLLVDGFYTNTPMISKERGGGLYQHTLFCILTIPSNPFHLVHPTPPAEHSPHPIPFFLSYPTKFLDQCAQ